jgi:hypothetical protein
LTQTTFDSFHASNNFYGGQLGLRGDYHLGHFFVEAAGKVALGSMNQSINISGASSSNSTNTVLFPPGVFLPATNFVNAPGGFFAQGTNSGHFSRNVFAVVPEADFKIGYNITRNIQGFVGYSFLYLNDVLRPGTTIDHSLNLTQVPIAAGFPNTLVGPSAPNFSFTRSDFWAQGINFGVQFKF